MMEAHLVCSSCYDTLPGLSLGEAREDAFRVGWVERRGRMVCDQCVIEEEALV